MLRVRRNGHGTTQGTEAASERGCTASSRLHRIGSQLGEGFGASRFSRFGPTSIQTAASATGAALTIAKRETDKWANFSPRYRKDLGPVFEYLNEKISHADVSILTLADV